MMYRVIEQQGPQRDESGCGEELPALGFERPGRDQLRIRSRDDRLAHGRDVGVESRERGVEREVDQNPWPAGLPDGTQLSPRATHPSREAQRDASRGARASSTSRAAATRTGPRALARSTRRVSPASRSNSASRTSANFSMRRHRRVVETDDLDEAAERSLIAGIAALLGRNEAGVDSNRQRKDRDFGAPRHGDLDGLAGRNLDVRGPGRCCQRHRRRALAVSPDAKSHARGGRTRGVASRQREVEPSCGLSSRTHPSRCSVRSS